VRSLLFLLPSETWICIIVLAGFLIIIGFRKAGFSLIGGVVLLALFSPFIEAFVELLPTWLLIIIMIFFAMSLLRLIFGERAADHVIGRLLYDIILLPFRFIGWFFRSSRGRI
jgi:hypothetical protein